MLPTYSIPDYIDSVQSECKSHTHYIGFCHQRELGSLQSLQNVGHPRDVHDSGASFGHSLSDVLLPLAISKEG